MKIKSIKELLYIKYSGYKSGRDFSLKDWLDACASLRGKENEIKKAESQIFMEGKNDSI